jgi:hypothetical protein
MERANCKGRFNLRVSLATAKSYSPVGANANRNAPYATVPSPRLAGGSMRRTSPLRDCIAAVIDSFASRS